MLYEVSRGGRTRASRIALATVPVLVAHVPFLLGGVFLCWWLVTQRGDLRMFLGGYIVLALLGRWSDHYRSARPFACVAGDAELTDEAEAPSESEINGARSSRVPEGYRRVGYLFAIKAEGDFQAVARAVREVSGARSSAVTNGPIDAFVEISEEHDTAQWRLDRIKAVGGVRDAQLISNDTGGWSQDPPVGYVLVEHGNRASDQIALIVRNTVSWPAGLRIDVAGMVWSAGRSRPGSRRSAKTGLAARLHPICT